MGLRLEQITCQVYGAGRPYLPESTSPLLRNYVEDLGALWEVAPRGGVLTETTRNSYADMVEDMLSRLAPSADPVDLVVIAGSTPDADVLQSPTSVLALQVPGDPLPLGIADQGSAGPFTALRTIQAYGGGRAIFMIMDQSRLWYDLPMGPGQAARLDCAVAMVFGDSGGVSGFAVERHMDVAPEELGSLLPSGDFALIAGDSLRGHVPEDLVEVLFAPAGQPCTGVWKVLAETLPAWPGRQVVVAEYDPVLRYLSLCAVEVA